jgi:hypothetical protein
MPPEKHVIKPDGENKPDGEKANGTGKPNVVPIMPPLSPEDEANARRQAKAAHTYDIGNQVLSFLVSNTETPVEAMGVLVMLQTRLAMGLNSDLWRNDMAGSDLPPRGVG